MIKDLWLIGIGTGSPSHLTLEGQQALRDAGVVLLPRKGPGKDDLADIRHAILSAAGATARVVPFDMPERDESLPYRQRVARWHDEIACIWQKALSGETVNGPVAVLVWGDPVPCPGDGAACKGEGECGVSQCAEVGQIQCLATLEYHVCVEGASLEEAIREARRRFCLDMPRLWDLIQSIDVSRFRVRSLPSTEDR